MKNVALLIIVFALTGCKRTDYPAAPKGNSEAALVTRVYLYLMYEFNNTPVDQQANISRTAIVGDFKGGHKPRVQSLEEARALFSVETRDVTTTQATVLIQARRPKKLTWTYLGNYKAQSWVLHNAEWVCSGNPDPFYGWNL